MFRVGAILASLSSAAHLDGACPAGECPSVEQDETGMIQSKASLTHVRRHQHMKATPNNTADCKNSSIVPNTNPSIPMVYDDTCPGLGCFETYPCRYCRDDTKDMAACKERAALTQVEGTPNNTADCKNSLIVPNTNPSIPMVYDDTCPGLGCFETYPCRYCRDDTKDMPACKERAALTQVKGTPNNTADCKNSSIVPNTNPSIPMVYDDTCPGLGCFETYPCRYCRDDTKDMPACKERAALTQVKGTPNNTADCKNSSIVPNTNPSIPMVYDDTCPGLGCFETYPCRYCRDDTKDMVACKERAALTQVEGTPNNTADCKNSLIVPNTNPSIPMVYDDTCPGLGCFETYPCRYCRDDTKDMPACKERAALTQVKGTPNNTADCKNSSIVPNTNPSIPMVYDDTCPGLGCFETYPCRYCRDDTKDVPACKERAVLTQVKGTPNNTADCKNSSIVPNTNPSIPMVYDDSCPGLGCFETYPCRYCRDDTKDMPACKERAALTTKKATPGTP